VKGGFSSSSNLDTPTKFLLRQIFPLFHFFTIVKKWNSGIFCFIVEKHALLILF